MVLDRFFFQSCTDSLFFSVLVLFFSFFFHHCCNQMIYLNDAHPSQLGLGIKLREKKLVENILIYVKCILNSEIYSYMKL